MHRLSKINWVTGPDYTFWWVYFWVSSFWDLLMFPGRIMEMVTSSFSWKYRCFFPLVPCRQGWHKLPSGLFPGNHPISWLFQLQLKASASHPAHFQCIRHRLKLILLAQWGSFQTLQQIKSSLRTRREGGEGGGSIGKKEAKANHQRWN